MQNINFKVSQRNLPHWELEGAVYFITFNTWKKLELTKEARQIVFDSCLFFNNKRYKIFVLVVMVDHVHMLIQPSLKSEKEFWQLSSILHSIKSYSVKKIPTVMKHIDTIWQDKDMIILSEVTINFKDTGNIFDKILLKQGYHLLQRNIIFSGKFSQNTSYSLQG